MGACNSNTNCSSKPKRRRSFNSKIEYDTVKTEVPQVDDSLKDMPEIINHIEELRKKFSVNWNNFLNNSGAVVLVNPTIKSCLTGYLYKFSCELNEKNLRTVKIENNPPWVIFEFDYLMTKEGKEFLKDIDTFLNFTISIHEETENLNKSFKEKYENIKILIDEFKMDNLTLEEKERISRQFMRKMEVLDKANETIKLINNIVTSRENEIHALQEEIKTKEFIDDFIKVSIEVHESKSSHEGLGLMWKYSSERKLQSLSEARMKVQESRFNKDEIEGVKKD